MSNPLNLNDLIDVPPLVFGPIKQKIGYIQHLIEPGIERRIVAIGEIRVSPKVKVPLYSLDDGQQVIISERKKISPPDGVDGVLHFADSHYKWTFHRKWNEFSARMLSEGLESIAKEIQDSWNGIFSYKVEKKNADGEVISKGLRPPQIGGLHSIGAHWSVSNSPATIVMPTGTGKTETMLATMLAHNPGKILIIVPSKVLRDQTAKKFLELGLLRKLETIPSETKNPIVGVIEHRPGEPSDLDIFSKCNVVIAVMNSLGEVNALNFSEQIADKIDVLIVDEAHHVAADRWSSFKEKFHSKKVIQFTATPYRRDGKLVDGKDIFEYSLSQAQKDEYFKKISFEPVYDIDLEGGDQAIAVAASEKLRSVLLEGYDHILMARCKDIGRAQDILRIYQEVASEFNPVIIHSEEGNTSSSLGRIFSRQSRIVVCVNMLGEGFDLPQLKIAAIHDTHKSLAILLQFTGRFTRSAAANIGDATVIANIADQDVSSALERLYSEDSDWNDLLSEFSSEAARSHSALIRFLNSSERLDEPTEETVEISHHLLTPIHSTLTYHLADFKPKNFFEGIPKSVNIHQVWLNDESNTLFFVTKTDLRLKWTRSKEVYDRVWQLFVLHYDPSHNLLYLASSDKSSTHEKLAKAVGATSMIQGDAIFRALGRINRLVFQNVGVKKHGRRNLSYAQYTGSDVATALGLAERQGSSKSNLNGTGWEDGAPVSIGCSIKGRVWTRESGTIPEFIQWSEQIGAKLVDESIDTRQIISNVLIPKELTELDGGKVILCIEWPFELLRKAEDKILLSQQNRTDTSLGEFEISPGKIASENSGVEFIVHNGPDNVWAKFRMVVGGVDGYKIEQITGSPVNIRVGVIETSLTSFLSDYPPLIKFVDLSELDGNLLIEPPTAQVYSIPIERFESWDWNGVDISKESIIKDGRDRQDSIQWAIAGRFTRAGFDVVFNDDAPGEAADLVCLKEEEDYIRLVLAHCKFTKGNTAGERVGDIVEVCSQAIKSAKWKWKFKDLCQHLIRRSRRLNLGESGSRYITGSTSDINRFSRLSRFKEIRPEIVIVQPGISMSSQSQDQLMILGAAHSYLKETIGVDLDIICSE